MKAMRSLANGIGIPTRLLRESGGNMDTLRQLAPLPEDAERIFDGSVIDVGLDRLALVREMLSRGLVFNLPNALGVMEVHHQRTGRSGFAQRSMLPDTRGENQLPEMDAVATPIYVTHDDFNLNVRLQMMSERVGIPLDGTLAAHATRNVNEALEDAAINGWTDAAGNAVKANGVTTYGLLTAPSASSVAYTGNEAWDNAGHTGEEIIGDILRMVDAQIANHKYGPYTLFIPTLYDNKLNYDYKSATSGTIRQRISELNVGNSPLSIITLDRLPANRTALVQMTSDVLDLIVGFQPTVFHWTSLDGFNDFWKVMACMVPRFKDTIDGDSGVVLGYTS